MAPLARLALVLLAVEVGVNIVYIMGLLVVAPCTPTYGVTPSYSYMLPSLGIGNRRLT